MKLFFKFIILLSIALFSVPIWSVFSAETDTVEPQKEKTIKELRENINELETERKELKNNWDQFLSENGWVEDFLKTDIWEEDEIRLQEIIQIYREYKIQLDTRLKNSMTSEEDEEIRKNLLRQKQVLYKKLVYFIRTDRLNDFLEYVKWDLEVNEKRRDVTKEISKDKEALEEKVETIREKIKENKDVLEERIRNSISERLNIKIGEILANEEFIKLEIDIKRNLFQTTIEKAEAKQQELEAILNKTTIINQKIEVYNIMKQKLTEAMETFQ